MQNAFFGIGFVDIGGDSLVAALVGINLAHDKEGGGALGLSGFGDGVVNFRLAAVEALYGDGIKRLQLDGLVLR